MILQVAIKLNQKRKRKRMRNLVLSQTYMQALHKFYVLF